VTIQVVIDSESPSEQKISSRLLVTTSTGAVQLWSEGELKWVREESLANIVVAEFAELPERASESSIDSTGKGFFARITRQLAIAQVCILNFI
jgi:ER membrane protein complex subunit 1